MIQQQNYPLSLRRQCQLLGVARSVLYYRPAGPSESDLTVMRLLDEQYTRTPFYGVERMTVSLQRSGMVIGHNRVRRLLRLMCLEAIYPKPRLSQPSDQNNRKYPYLLAGLKIDQPNQVWAAEITYVRLWRGFVYLVAIMDWFSRYVLSWALSVTLEVYFCLEALEAALRIARPQIFNSDQGSQFTSVDFIESLKASGAQISMDGRGRVFDNIFVERLWRTVKYEEIYLKDYQDVDQARQGLGDYFGFYNHQRLHQALGYRTPAEVYFDTGKDVTASTASSISPGLQLAVV